MPYKGSWAKQPSDGRGIDVSRRWLSFPVSDGLLRTCACLPYALITAHENQAGIGIGRSAPMDSDVIVHVFEPMPGQDFLGSTANELRVLAGHCLTLDDGGHAGKGLPEMAAIRT